MQNTWACKHDCECDIKTSIPQAASRAGIGRRVKRETALVRGTIDVTCQSRIKSLYETSGVSLFTHCLTPVLLLAACCIYCQFTIMLACLVSCFAFSPQIRETAPSLSWGRNEILWHATWPQNAKFFRIEKLPPSTPYRDPVDGWRYCWSRQLTFFPGGIGFWSHLGCAKENTGHHNYVAHI